MEKIKKERFYVDIIIILVILLSLSNISYSNNIFGSYILEKGILNINIEKITYKNGTEQEQDIVDYEGNQISLDTELIQSIFGNTTGGSLDYNYFIKDTNIDLSSDTIINDIKGILFTGTDTGIKIQTDKTLNISNNQDDSFFGAIGVNSENNSVLFRNTGIINIDTKKILLIGNFIGGLNRNSLISNEFDGNNTMLQMNLGSENTQELIITNNTINGDRKNYLLYHRYPLKENNSTIALKAKFIEISKNSITANNNIGEMREDAFRKTASLVSSRNIKKTEIGTNSTEILKFSYNIINSKGLVYLIEYNNALVRNRKVMHEVDFLPKKIEIINNSLNSGFKNSILFYNNYSKTTIGFNNTDELNFSSNTVYGYYKNSLIQNVYNGKFTTKGKILNITNNVLRSEVVVGVTYLLYNSSILNIENNEINITNNKAISYKQQTDTNYVKNKTNLSNILYNSEEMNIGTDDSIIVNINYNSILSDITTGSYNIKWDIMKLKQYQKTYIKIKKLF